MNAPDSNPFIAGFTVVFVILILLMVFRPTGLLGQTVGDKV